MKHVVLFSGGLDSTLVLMNTLYNLPPKSKLITYTVDYDQTNKIEIERAKQIIDLLNANLPVKIEHRITKLTLPKIQYDDYVVYPLRNIVIATYIAAQAIDNNDDKIKLYLGINGTDAARFQDCRADVLKDLRILLESFNVDLITPLLAYEKNSDNYVHLVYRFSLNPIFKDVLRLTYSCYAGTEPPCNTCVACNLRNAVLRKLKEQYGIELT